MSDFILKVELINSRDWIAIIVSAVIPVIIMGVTLWCSKRENKRLLKQQEQEHIDIMNQQTEATRLSVMPIFDIVAIIGRKENLYKRESNEAKHIIEIRLKNVGNGIAMNTYLKWKSDIDTKEYYPVYKDENAIYTCYKTFSYDNTIATIGKEINVYLIRKGENQEDKSENSIVLPISYCDVLDNHYEQKITMSYYISDQATGEVEAFDVTPLIPSLVEKSEEEEGKEEK